MLDRLLALTSASVGAEVTLATMGHILSGSESHPEARRCIEAVVDLDRSTPLAHFLARTPSSAPWWRYSQEPMTWCREQALLRLELAECVWLRASVKPATR